jgi:integrase
LEPRALTKRGNGEGSIYRRKADGRWCAAIWTGDRQRILYGKTRQEVGSKLLEAQKQQGHEQFPRDGIPTVEQFLGYWLRESVKPRLRPLTYAGYSVNVHKHLVPALGRIRLDQLTPRHVQEMINERTAAGLSAKSVAYIHQVLRTALQLAVRWEMVPRNVASLVDRPRRVRKEIHPLAPAEARRFLIAVRGHRLEALFSVALALGLRQGEALGLSWQDVDLKARTLKVRNQLQRIGGRLVLVEPKSDRSRRTLVIPATIVESLREHEKRQVAEKLWAGSGWKETGLVFTNRAGEPIQARHVIEQFHQELKKAGLERRRFHDLRHSCATLLLVQGVAPRVVMEILGHSEIGLTMNTYSHVVPELQRDAADRMESLLTQPTQHARERD